MSYRPSLASRQYFVSTNLLSKKALAHLLQRQNYSHIFYFSFHTCLLAKTRRVASLSSSSPNIRFSSSLASPARSRSLLSTTKIRPNNRNIKRIHPNSNKIRTTLNSQRWPTGTLRNISNSKTGNHTLCILKVMSPKWPNFVLTADIPNCEAYVLVLHCFHVKT